MITGTGRGFCSGGDVEEIIGALQELETAELLEFTRMTGAVVKAMRECPLPVIAAVNGVAAGAGSVIALAADMGSAYLLPRIVGLGRATELLILGDKVSAERSLQIGLATDVVGDGELAARATALARRIADGPAFAYATTKVLLTRELDMDLGSAIELEAITQALLMKSGDHGEFYRAWTEGRAPAWQGR